MVEWCCLQWMQLDAWLALGCSKQHHSAIKKFAVMVVGMRVGMRVGILKHTVGICVGIRVGIRVGIVVGMRVVKSVVT